MWAAGWVLPRYIFMIKYRCDITGISISALIWFSAASGKKGCSKRVRFQAKDALENGFPENIDLVWQMESSHLMRDKKKLFSEIILGFLKPMVFCFMRLNLNK